MMPFFIFYFFSVNTKLLATCPHEDFYIQYLHCKCIGTFNDKNLTGNVISNAQCFLINERWLIHLFS